MSDKTKIEWTDASWNPVTGCDKVSPGCDHCYAESIAHRFAGTAAYPDGFAVALRPYRLGQPLRWKRPRKIFVNSMSDLFHEQIPDDYIARVFAVMAAAPWHTFQVLTKRHARMRHLMRDDDFRAEVTQTLVGWEVEDGLDVRHLDDEPGDWWPLRNVWLGVSAEDQKWADIRIPALLDTPAAVRYVSAEPLLAPIELSPEWLAPPMLVCPPPSRQASTAAYAAAFAEIGRAALRKVSADRGEVAPAFLDWVIVGGESGPLARPMHPDWVRSLRDRCVAAGVPFFFKQYGEFVKEPGFVDDFVRVGKRVAGRVLDGRTWDEFPEVAA